MPLAFERLWQGYYPTRVVTPRGLLRPGASYFREALGSTFVKLEDRGRGIAPQLWPCKRSLSSSILNFNS
jgi:hypothetical protein